MKYTLLGKSDLSVSEISFGCMSLGEDQLLPQSIVHTIPAERGDGPLSGIPMARTVASLR